MTRYITRARTLAAANSKWRVFLDDLTDGHGNQVPDYMVVEAHEFEARPDHRRCRIAIDRSGFCDLALLPACPGKGAP